MKKGFVYILASQKNGTLYVGVTSNLEKRVYQHKEGVFEKSFTKRYGVHMLVYFEECSNIVDAIQREKQLKNWHRKRKIELIESMNPERNDLSEGW